MNETMPEPGLRECVLLPPGVELCQIFEADEWSGFYLQTPNGFIGDYSLDPPPNEEEVLSHLTGVSKCWYAGCLRGGMPLEEAEQIIAHLRHRGWVL